jgi:hypothetical protein
VNVPVLLLLGAAAGYGAYKLLSAPDETPTEAVVIPSPSARVCVHLGTQRSLFDTIMAGKIAEAQRNGLEIHRLTTGDVTLIGTKSQFNVVEVWACPPGILPPPRI